MIKNRFLFILILGALSAIGPLSIDMYLPGFLVIAKELHTSTEKVAYSLSGFFVGICFGQLLFGPLLDRFGRKSPLLAGIIIYIVASVGCSYASSISGLVICRFSQAIGACAGLVTPRAIVRDLFPVKDVPRIFSLLVLVLGVSPIIAPSKPLYK